MESTYYDNESQRIVIISVPTRTSMQKIKVIVEAFKPKNAIGEPVIASDCYLNLNGDLIDLRLGTLKGEKQYAVRWDKGNVGED